MKYQRAVSFQYQGLRGYIDAKNRIIFGNNEFHLDDLSIESSVRQVIHKVRNGECRESLPRSFHFKYGVTI